MAQGGQLARQWFIAGLPHEWSVEKYGELLTTGGGKERMTRYFKVSRWLCQLQASLSAGDVSQLPALEHAAP